MMRELDTLSPVAWPSWCYSGEGREDIDAASVVAAKEEAQNTAISPVALRKSRGKRRGHASMSIRRHDSNGDLKGPVIDEKTDADQKVKSERLSPINNSATHGDNNSNSSRSCTPSSSYPGTPSDGGSHLKQMEQMMMTRNYSDFMRSLAAKYNHANPNDYFSATRNGYPQSLDPRFSAFKNAASPFVAMMAPMAATPSNQPSSATASDLSKTQKTPAEMLSAAFGASSLNTLFPPMIDMSSTQALLNMVRTANAQNHAQLDSYLKGYHVSNLKRNSDSSPLDLSSAAPSAKNKKDNLYSVENFLNMPVLEALRGKNKQSKRSSSATSPAPPRLSPVCVSDSRTLCTEREGQSVAHWSVDDVCAFVGSIDTCAEYEKNFREERIDGSSLPLLTEEHLTNSLGMKLGPALKLRATLAKRLGHCSICLHCVHCHVTSSSITAPSLVQPMSSASAPLVPTVSTPAPHLVGNRPSSAGN